MVILFFIIWIATGAIIGALVNTVFRGGKIELVLRVVTATAGAAALGYLANFVGFEPGGPYLAPALTAAVGALLALFAAFYAKQM